MDSTQKKMIDPYGQQQPPPENNTMKYVLVGTTLAGLGVGGYFLWESMKEKDEPNTNVIETTKKTKEQNATAANIRDEILKKVNESDDETDAADEKQEYLEPWGSFTGKYFQYGDPLKKNFNAETGLECLSKCRENAECLWSVYNKQKKTCSTYKPLLFKDLQFPRTSGVRTNNDRFISVDDTVLSLSMVKDPDNYKTHKTYDTSTLDECIKNCKDDKKCAAFEHNPRIGENMFGKTKQCILFAFEENEDMDMFISHPRTTIH